MLLAFEAQKNTIIFVVYYYTMLYLLFVLSYNVNVFMAKSVCSRVSRQKGTISIKIFKRLLAIGAIAGAVAGAYYFWKNSKEEDNLDDPEKDVNDDLEDFLQKETESQDSNDEEAKREYVPLNFSKEAVDEVKKEDAGESAHIIGEPRKNYESPIEKAADNNTVSEYTPNSFA